MATSTNTQPSKSPNSCEIILLDGGLGTTLTSPPHSITFTDDTPLWSSHLLISSPATLLSAQKSFVDAGAEVVITATYQASFEGFRASGVEGKVVRDLMRSAVRVGREAFGVGEEDGRDGGVSGDEGGGNTGRKKGRGKVALSLGAYGAVMVPSQEYSGAYDEGHRSVEELREWHLERLGVFLPLSSSIPLSLDPEKHTEAGAERKVKQECWENVDLVAFETLPKIEEIIAARETIFHAYQHLPSSDYRPFWISCVFPGESNLLPDGSSIPEIVKAMLGKREKTMMPMGIGINCTKVGKLEGLVREFEDAVKELRVGERRKGREEWEVEGEGVSLVIYPDGTMKGEVYDTVTKEWVVSDMGAGVGNQKPWDEEVFDIVMRARDRRVWKSIYVGGCCRTGPREIGRLRKRIDGV